MAKIKSLAELKKLKTEMKNKVEIREKGDNIEKLTQVKVSMATCGIAAGAKQIMDKIIAECNELGLDDVVVTQTGCMGLCHSEPTIEISKPGEESLVFGHVTEDKASEIVSKYIKDGVLVDGIIPAAYKTIEE